MTAPIDYNAVLADLEAKRAEIDAAIRVISGLLGNSAAASGSASGETAKVAGPRPVTPVGQGMQSDTFFGLSTSAAVRKFLSITKRPQSPRAIADALVAGGQVHAADPKVAYTNVYTALKRGKDTEFSQTRNKEWGLVEWYSGKSKTETE